MNLHIVLQILYKEILEREIITKRERFDKSGYSRSGILSRTDLQKKTKSGKNEWRGKGVIVQTKEILAKEVFRSDRERKETKRQILTLKKWKSGINTM